MTEQTDATHPTSSGPTPGQLLRSAREAAGMDLAVMAATLKVPLHKLERLEQDALEQVGDLTFVRTLAKSICKLLKQDAQPILDALPQVSSVRLNVASNAAQAPLGKPITLSRGGSQPLRSKVFWGVAVILSLTAFVAWVPTQWLQVPSEWLDRTTQTTVEASPLPASAESSVPAVLAPGVTVEPAAPVMQSPGVEPPAALPAPAPEAAPVPKPPEIPPTSSAWMIIRAQGQSWIEVSNAKGQVLVSKVLKADEAVEISQDGPLKLVAGNAPAIEVSVRGQRLDLTPHAKGNVARLNIQ